MSAENLSAILFGKRDIKLIHRPIESLLSSNVGLCGSDLHQWADARIGEKVFFKPFVLGHEGSGTVVQIGGNVTNLAVGDKVAIEPGIGCGFCGNCKIGRYNLCPDMRFFSTLKPANDGILCRFKSHPAHLCHKLPEHLNMKQGALMEPLSVAVHACQRAKLSPGDTVLICGAGPIGTLCAMVAKAFGCSDITITDINPDRLNLVERIFPQGSISTLLINGMSTLDIAKQFANPPFIVLECTGEDSSQYTALKLVKKGGTVVLVGLSSPNTTFPLAEVVSKEINIRGVFRYANCFPKAISLVESGAIDTEAFLNNSVLFDLENTEEAFKFALRGNVMKTFIKC